MLTPDELSHLSNQVAEHVMGWRRVTIDRSWDYWTQSDGRWIYWTADSDAVEASSGYEWAPAARWDHAGIVLDHLLARGFEIHVDVFQRGGVDVNLLSNDAEGYARGELTVPLAICRAALRTVGMEL